MLIGKGDRPDLIELVGGLVALALTSDMTAGAAAAMARRVERAEKAQQHLAKKRAFRSRLCVMQPLEAVQFACPRPSMMRDELTACQLQLQPLLLAWLVEVRNSHNQHHTSLLLIFLTPMKRRTNA